jgi:hypothetical protein
MDEPVLKEIVVQFNFDEIWKWFRMFQVGQFKN